MCWVYHDHLLYLPIFGREVIGWVVDMCSVGTAFGYFLPVQVLIFF